MKVNEVPQDRAFLVEGRMSDLYYVLDDKGRYTRATSKGWTPKNDAIKLAWKMVYENAEAVRQQVLSGKLSPIALYMELNVMDVHILASYTGLPRRKVKKHMKMKGFRKLTPELVKTYAGALDMTPDELLDIERIKRIEIEHEN